MCLFLFLLSFYIHFSLFCSFLNEFLSSKQTTATTNRDKTYATRVRKCPNNIFEGKYGNWRQQNGVFWVGLFTYEMWLAIRWWGYIEYMYMCVLVTAKLKENIKNKINNKTRVILSEFSSSSESPTFLFFLFVLFIFSFFFNNRFANIMSRASCGWSLL